MAMTGYSIFDIAVRFLEKRAMEQRKLQYLCYYAFAWDSAIRDGSLLAGCEFQARPQGPVNVGFYKALQKFENDIVNVSCLPVRSGLPIGIEDLDFLERVWATYGSHCSNVLGVAVRSEIPWFKVRTGLNSFEPSSNVISVQDISEFYRSIYAG